MSNTTATRQTDTAPPPSQKMSETIPRTIEPALPDILLLARSAVGAVTSIPNPSDTRFVADRTSPAPTNVPPPAHRPTQIASAGGLPRVFGMQKWEGRVVEVDGDLFTAELVPEDPDGVRVLADFDTSLLISDDVESIEPGDVIYVTVRTIIGAGGYKTQTSSVRMRRLGRWSERDVQQIRRQARAQATWMEEIVD